MRCEVLVDLKCRCGKTSTKVACYKINYPESKRKQIMSEEEIKQVTDFRCKIVCKQHKSCN